MSALWIEAALKTFSDHAEMQILAFVHRYGVRPIVFQDAPEIGKRFGYLASFCLNEPQFTQPFVPAIDPRMAELAKHAHAAWETFTKGLDPARSLVEVRVIGPGRVSVEIRERNPDDIPAYVGRQTMVGGPSAPGTPDLARNAAALASSGTLQARGPVSYDDGLRSLVCRVCASTLPIAKMPPPGSTYHANPAESEWIRKHTGCSTPAAAKA